MDAKVSFKQWLDINGFILYAQDAGISGRKKGMIKLTSPKTLAMRKMEKNFIAHLEKKYPRKPYSKYSMGFFIKRLREETHELEGAILAGHFDNAMEECADISNIVDFIFERLMIVMGRGLNADSEKEEKQKPSH